jgi:hypothetical protein
MPVRLFAGRCKRPTRKNSLKPSQTEPASSRAHEEENGTRCQKDRDPIQGTWLEVSESSVIQSAAVSFVAKIR